MNSDAGGHGNPPQLKMQAGFETPPAVGDAYASRFCKISFNAAFFLLSRRNWR